MPLSKLNRKDRQDRKVPIFTDVLEGLRGLCGLKEDLFQRMYRHGGLAALGAGEYIGSQLALMVS